MKQWIGREKEVRLDRVRRRHSSFSGCGVSLVHTASGEVFHTAATHRRRMDTNPLIHRVSAWISWGHQKNSHHRGDPPSPHHQNDHNQQSLSDSSDEPNLLLSLLFPDVTNALVDHLDDKSLLNLRLVCRTTKMWVDQPRFLSKLRITMHSSLGAKKMKKVIRSKTDFCNFRIGYEKKTNDELILELGTRFGPVLKVLDINTMTGHGVTINILEQCVNIESLTLLGLNLSKVPATALEDLRRISGTLSHLKQLSIGNILFLSETELEYFSLMISLCTSLQMLRLPYVNFQSRSDRLTRNRILAKYIVNPVANLIKVRGQSTSSRLRHLILEFLNPALPSDLFLLLAETCYRYKSTLHNVHESHLKSPDSSPKTVEEVQEIIGTLDGLNCYIKLSRLLSLTCISVWVSAAVGLADDNITAPSMPRLNSINLFIDTSEEDPRIQKLVGAILEVPRPSVTSLKISYNSRRGPVSASLVRASAIVTNFEYLRKLDIYQWDAFDEEFLILWGGSGIWRLSNLSLLLCTNLSDRGLLGPHSPSSSSPPPFLKLTGLKDLQISSLYGSITDAAIFRAFRHMTLEKFRLTSQSVTYEGIESLLDGSFCSSIEFVNCSKPLDCTQKEFYYLVKDILNAKHNPSHLKRHHRRRCSQP